MNLDAIALVGKLTSGQQDELSYLNANGRNKSYLTSIAVGRILANRLPIPTGTVENFEHFYRTTYQIEVTRNISKINEVLLLDVETVQTYVLKFFKLRYVMMNPACNVYCVNPDTALQDFLGISQQLDSVTVQEIRSNPKELMKVNNFVNSLVAVILGQ